MSYKTPALHTFSWQQPVKDKDLTAPPGGETKGDRYIVASGGTDAWSGKDNQIATYNGSGWDFTVPTEGMITWVQDEDVYYKYISAWSVLLASDLMKVSDTRHFVGTFTRSMAEVAGTQEITGVGFQPKNLLFLFNVAGNSAAGIGLDNTSIFRSIINYHNITSTVWTYVSWASISVYMSLGNNYQGKVTTLGANGFTITWAKEGSPTGTITVNYIAFK